MMSGKFARIRGRVHGPFSDDKLRSMIRRGQLGRMHEISDDGHAWLRASEYPDLFENVANSSNAVVSNKNESSVAEDSPRPQQNVAEWYYAKNEQQFGPISEEELRDMLNNSQLSPSDQVWQHGMPSWTKVESIGALDVAHAAKLESPHVPGSSSAMETQIQDARLQQTILASRGWILVVLILTYLYAATLIASGIWYTVMGIKYERTEQIATGLLTVIFAGVLSALVALLNKHYSILGRFRRSVERTNIEEAFNTLKSFWITLAVVMIILFTFVVIGAVMVTAFGISLI